MSESAEPSCRLKSCPFEGRGGKEEEETFSRKRRRRTSRFARLSLIQLNRSVLLLRRCWLSCREDSCPLARKQRSAALRSPTPPGTSAVSSKASSPSPQRCGPTHDYNNNPKRSHKRVTRTIESLPSITKSHTGLPPPPPLIPPPSAPRVRPHSEPASPATQVQSAGTPRPSSAGGRVLSEP